MTSSIVMTPTASSSSASFGSESPFNCRISASLSLDHLLLLDLPLNEFARCGKLFHFWSDLLLFNFFSCGIFSSSTSNLTSTIFSVKTEEEGIIRLCMKSPSHVYSHNAKKYHLPLLAASVLGNVWILSQHCLTTTAMWLWPFWNSFNISYNGKVSGTLENRKRTSNQLLKHMKL